MGTDLTRFFSKKIYSPVAHEKMLNTISHLGKANESHNKNHLIPTWHGWVGEK